MQTESPPTTDTIQQVPLPDDERAVPCPEAVRAAGFEVLRRGSAHKADILKVDLGQGPFVLKDFSSKPWFWRQLGRLQIRRELAAYRYLRHVEGVPRLLGAVDADALALQWIDGGLLKTLPDRVERGVKYVAELREILDRIHATGLAHLDLRSNNNIVVRRDGRVFVLDFASAVHLNPGSLLHRLIFPFLQNLDISGLLKWNLCLAPGTLTPVERKRLERHDWLSALWIVNRKRKKGGK